MIYGISLIWVSLALGITAIYRPGTDNLDTFLKEMDNNMYEEKNTKHDRK